MFWPRRSNMASSRLKRWLRWVRKLWRVVWLFRAANSAWRKQKKVTQSKHFQVISLPGRRNEKQRREIWWRKIRSSLVRFSLFVLFCLFVFFCVTEQEKDRRRNERLLVGLSYCEDDTTKWNCTWRKRFWCSILKATNQASLQLCFV